MPDNPVPASGSFARRMLASLPVTCRLQEAELILIDIMYSRSRAFRVAPFGIAGRPLARLKKTEAILLLYVQRVMDLQLAA